MINWISNSRIRNHNAGRKLCHLLITLVLLATPLVGLVPQFSLAAPVPTASAAAKLAEGRGSGDAAALAAGTMSLSPSDSYILVGETVSVDVWISDVTDLYGLDFVLWFDSTIVSVPTNNGTLLWEVFDPVNNFTVRNAVYPSPPWPAYCSAATNRKFYWYSVTQTEDWMNPGYPLPFSGSGRVARLTFQGVEVGTSALHFCYAKGSTKDGVPLWPTVVDGSITVVYPTAVKILWFEATSGKKIIRLGWETASESDNLGFNLYRATSEDGPRTKLNKSLIPTNVPPGSPSGAVYSYTDKTARRRTTYYYWLEDVDIYGHTELYGPVEASY